MFRIIERDMGYGPTEWLAPEKDEKIEGVFHGVAEIDEWVHLCRKHDVAVQAGGNIGVWALRLRQIFNEVYTFEPQIENFSALMANIGDADIMAYNHGLSDTIRKVSVRQLEGQKNNYGAGFIVDDADGKETMRVDDLGLSDCDLLCLDIEGAELEALKGAEETIQKYHPLVVLEDKPMPQLRQFKREVGDPGAWLIARGYTFVMKQRWDKIFKWG